MDDVLVNNQRSVSKGYFFFYQTDLTKPIWFQVPNFFYIVFTISKV